LSAASQSLRAWWLACRPKTLSAAVVPVMVGSAVAFKLEGFRAGPALAALVGALLIQIGSNLANDVFDYEKGADTGARLGPLRVVQAGLLSPGAVRTGMLIVFGLALLVGIYLTAVAGLPIVVIGLCSIAAAMLYTAGPFPLGYHGLGDLFVMVFFGLVAVCGTVYVQLLSVPELALWCSLPVGSLATAILVVNNVRDRETDVVANKRTLAVRFGHKAGLVEYAGLMSIPYLVPVLLLITGQVSLWLLLPLLSLPLAVRLVRRIYSEVGARLNGVLVGTAKLLLVYGILFSLSLWLDARMAT
jgi:1,4-dihydroxy-2-naphthoate polyprenyltransferase